MVPRRDFVFSSAALSAAATAAITNSNAHAQSETNERTVRVGVMGLSRGQALATGFNKLDGVEVAWVCDVDGRRLSSSVKQLQEQGGGKAAPQTTKDFRDMLAFVEKHNIRPVIEKTFPLADAREALLYLEQQHKFGKVVVSV